MQVFHPHVYPTECAEALDSVRLGKQLMECQTIMSAITKKRWRDGYIIDNPKAGYSHHTVTRMYAPYPGYLMLMTHAYGSEWFARRGKHHASYLHTLGIFLDAYPQAVSTTAPEWASESEFFLAHQALLYSKDPVQYARYSSSSDVDVAGIYPVV